MRTLLFIMAAFCGTFLLAAHAQTDEEFFEAFSGDWFVFDPQWGNGGTCEVQLRADGEELFKPAEIRNCNAPLSGIARWTIMAGQLGLQTAEGVTIVRLGGNQQRITGEFADTGRGIVMERANGSPAAIDLAEALRRHRCFFLGYTDVCVSEEALARPVFVQDGGRLGEIETLVDLNVRSQPRPDAAMLGTVSEGSCIRINDCLVASDGIWCRARFGNQSGWLSKTALRQGEWPVVTYRNDCVGERSSE